MSASRPVLVFIPRAWHYLDAYEPCLSCMRARRYDVKVLALLALYITVRGNTNFVRENVLDIILHDYRNVVVVTLSYGGLVRPAAAHSLSKTTRVRDGKTHGVLGTVAISSVISPRGISMEASSGGLAPFVVLDKV